MSRTEFPKNRLNFFFSQKKFHSINLINFFSLEKISPLGEFEACLAAASPVVVLAPRRLAKSYFVDCISWPKIVKNITNFISVTYVF